MTYGNYREEFPDYDPATLPAIPADWKDESWHNNLSPSWDTGRKMIVHVDYADVSLREFPDGPRFYVINNDGTHNEDLFQSDDWNAVLAFVEGRAA